MSALVYFCFILPAKVQQQQPKNNNTITGEADKHTHTLKWDQETSLPSSCSWATCKSDTNIPMVYLFLKI